MQARRKFLFLAISGVVALGLIAVPVLADELFGTITSVDIEGKTLSVVPKDSEDTIKVKVTDQTEYITKKGNSKVDLEKISKNIEKAKDKGAKGVMVKIEHDKKVATKIYPAAKKKEAPKDN